MDLLAYESPIEKRLGEAFAKLGLYPKLQHQIGIFRVDFAFPEIKLVVECDGHSYHTGARNWKKNEYRQRRIEQEGWVFERFQGWLVYRHALACASKIALKYLPEKLDEKRHKMAEGAMVTMFIRTS